MNSTSRKLEAALSRMKDIDWYNRVGAPESRGDLQSIENYLSTLGRHGLQIRYVDDLNSVRLCTKSNFDPSWFDAEEEYRQKLVQSIRPAAVDCVNLSLKSVIDQLSNRVMGVAEWNLEGGDLQILKVAAGCAVEACYQYALEEAVGASLPRIFSKKLKIFEQGRWPLTASANNFIVY